METTTSLVADYAGSTSNQDGNSLGLIAFLNEDKAVVWGAKAHFLNEAGSTKLFGSDFFEAGDDTSTSGNCEELNFDSTNPSYSG